MAPEATNSAPGTHRSESEADLRQTGERRRTIKAARDRPHTHRGENSTRGGTQRGRCASSTYRNEWMNAAQNLRQPGGAAEMVGKT
jgi:hypothetical protein